ncbi:MAG: glycosyltransferase family 2 protein [Deltaproteobacteria bacterium]|nr:glycosyltransferase family 2 protein [Deltaproteobacteria bacterium]
MIPQGFQVSVVLPAYNESASIGALVRRALERVPGLLEVLVIDDGSTDDTAARARDAGARVVSLGRNGGKGGALRRGIAEARGDVLVFLDADGQDDPAETVQLLEALGPGVAMVVGSRFLGTFDRGAITPINRAGNRFLTGALNVLFGTRFTDTQAGFKAVRREALRGVELRARRFDIEVELLLRVLAGGGRVIEVPVRRAPRAHGVSRLQSFRDGTRILGRIVALRLGR